jgi:alpha-L-arabinofuranosidase
MRNRNSTNIQFLAKPTCNTCNKCEECDEIENKKKKNKNIFDKNLKTLNLIAFSIVFLIMVVSNLCIWIIVAT